ncbi:MAG: matrixin family metalloprotease [Planctomycetota bacterium]|nr:matrixin family metalloprotease [Planctomycetota bacterium]
MKPEVWHRSPGNRGSLARFLAPFLLLMIGSSCHILDPSTSSGDPYSGNAYRFPYGVMHRITGADGILWQLDPAGCPLDSELAEEAIETAMESWNLAGTCSFRRAEPTQEATLTISWKDADHGRPCVRFGISSELVAHIATAPTSGDPTPFSIHLNASVDWTLEKSPVKVAPSGTGLNVGMRFHPSLPAVMAHEAGHVLGLGHVLVEGSVMQPVPLDALGSPGEADLLAVRSLYGGGDASGADDLEICCVDPQGKPHLAAPIIRGLTPRDRVRIHLFDIDLDGRDEIVLLGRGRATDGSGLLILKFGDGALLERTIGPFPGALSGNLPLAVGKIGNGDTVLAQHPDDSKPRYHALVFPIGGPPLRPLLPGERWNSVSGGGGDEDGDGTLDQPITGIAECGIADYGMADLDGDGVMEWIRRGGESSSDP